MTPDQATLILAAYADRPVPMGKIEHLNRPIEYLNCNPAITRRAALHLAQRLIDGGWIRWHDQSQLRNLARFIQRNAQ